MGRGGAPAKEISFVSLMAYGLQVSDSALAMGFTASETRQGSSQHTSSPSIFSLYHRGLKPENHISLASWLDGLLLMVCL